MHYQLLHDQQLPLCFVGNTFHNHTLYEYFKSKRSCEHMTVEDVLLKDQDWVNQRQFMCAVTNIGFKKQVIDQLASYNPSWFSVVSDNSHIGYHVSVGVNTFINDFNYILDDTVIGDHCTITAHTTLSHSVDIGDFSHISPYSYLSFTKLGQGSCLGLRSSFPGKPDNILNIHSWCNFMINSVVTKHIVTPGTYLGNRRVNGNTSLTHKIL